MPWSPANQKHRTRALFRKINFEIIQQKITDGVKKRLFFFSFGKSILMNEWLHWKKWSINSLPLLSVWITKLSRCIENVTDDGLPGLAVTDIPSHAVIANFCKKFSDGKLEGNDDDCGDEDDVDEIIGMNPAITTQLMHCWDCCVSH